MLHLARARSDAIRNVIHRTNAGAFWLSHSFRAACDSNSATSIVSIVGFVSPTCLISASVISRTQSNRCL
jgi:hypothetical protein